MKAAVCCAVPIHTAPAPDSHYLLLPETPVDDAAAQVVDPLPLYHVIEDQLSGRGRAQETWRGGQEDNLTGSYKLIRSNSQRMNWG